MVRYMDQTDGTLFTFSPETRRIDRRGFTLIELLVVMAIIALMSGFVITALGTDDGSRALNSAITRMDATFSLAQSGAASRKTRTRVLVHFNHQDAENPDHYLRYVQIFYEESPNVWRAFADPELLPRNILFNPILSNAAGDRGLRVWTATVNPTNFNVTSAAPELTTDLNPGLNRWIVYEFNPNGTARFPMAKFVLSRGLVLPGSAAPNIPNEADSAGFVLFRSGKVVYFRDADHITRAN